MSLRIEISSKRSIVKMRNISSVNIEGIGDVQVRTNIGYTITLKNVHHVPDLRLNLLLGIAFDK